MRVNILLFFKAETKLIDMEDEQKKAPAIPESSFFSPFLSLTNNNNSSRRASFTSSGIWYNAADDRDDDDDDGAHNDNGVADDDCGGVGTDPFIDVITHSN